MLLSTRIKLRTIAYAVSCAAIMVNTAIAKQNDVPKLEIAHEVFKLDNGLTTIVYTDHKVPTVFMGMWYDVGSKDEPKGKNGFAHLFEHLMFKGSEHYKGEYSKPFELAGATGLNGSTGNDDTNYYATVPTEALDMALWMESERMGYLLSAVNEKALSDEQSIVKNEKRQSENQPGALSQQAHLAGFYPRNHPYAHSIIGTNEDLENATLDDVHQWFKKYYGASNATLVLAGDISVQEAKVIVKKYFAEMPVGEPLIKRQEWVAEHNEVTTTITYEKVPHTSYDRTYPLPAKVSSDTVLMTLVAETFANNINSPLYKKLVDELKLATHVESGVHAQKIASSFTVRANLKDGITLEQVDKIVEQELIKYFNNGPDKSLLEREKLSINMSLLNRMQYSSGIGYMLAEDYLATGDTSFYKKKLKWLNEATPEVLASVSQKWLNKGYYAGHTVPFPNYTSTKPTVDRSKIPNIGAPAPFSFPKHTVKHLNNGVKIVHINDNSLPIINTSIEFATGRNAEAQETAGVANATFSLFDKGTSMYTKSELTEKLQSLGVELRSNAGSNSSQLEFFTMNSNFEAALSLTAHILQAPKFDNIEIEKFKSEFGQYAASIENNPTSNSFNLSYTASYDSTSPIARSPTVEKVKALSRQQLVDFYVNEITPHNMTIYVAGNISVEETVRVVKKSFGEWFSRKPSKLRGLGNVVSKKRIVLVDQPRSTQSTVIVTQKLPTTSAQNKESIDLFAYILGGSFTSRLNLNLREDKGWSYGAKARRQLAASGDGLLMVRAQVQIDKTVDSMKEMVKELSQITSSKPISKSEFNKAIDNHVRSMNAKFTNNNDFLRDMSYSAEFKFPLNYSESASQRFLALDRKQVQRQINEIIDVNKLTWVVIGDLKKIEKEVRQLGYTDIEVWDSYGNKLR